MCIIRTVLRTMLYAYAAPAARTDAAVKNKELIDDGRRHAD